MAMFIAIIALVFFISCESKHDAIPTSNSEMNLEANFVALKSNIFQNKCSQCHSLSYYRSKGGDWLLETYQDYVESFPQILNAIKKGKMPKNEAPLLAIEINTLEEWQKLNFPIDNLSPLPDPNNNPLNNIPDPITWTFLNRTIFLKKCYSCHKQQNAEDRGEGFVYETYQQYKEDYEYVWEVIEADEMPEDAPPLSTIEKTLIQLWQKQGFAK